MPVRAKFRCNSITLSPATARTEEYDALIEEMGETYSSAKTDKEADARGIERYVSFDQPTVKLGAVVDGSEENRAFFSATPNAHLEMTISNPKAAETFELGKSYYVDFSPAD